MLESMKFHQPTEEWLRQRGLTPNPSEHPDWGFQIFFSTAPLTDWMTRKSHVKDTELWLGLGVSRLLGWKVKLHPKNKIYNIEWEASGIRVESDQMRFKKLTKWPALTELDQFPLLVSELEKLLAVQFQRDVQLHAASLKSDDLAVLKTWLGDLATSVQVFASSPD